MDARRWRQTVLSPQGPALAGMRLVLVAISVRMDEKGTTKVRLPIVELTRATKFSKPTVLRHLRDAVDQRWLERRHARGFGQAWQTYEFEACVPWSVRFHGEQGGKGARRARRALA